MKDLLEEHVPEKYYLSEKYLKCFSDMKNRNGFIRGERFNPRELEDCNIAFAITTRAGDRATDNFIKTGEKIRKLTPLEIWRLMGFSDTDFYAAKSTGISDAQLYKQAGNSIVVTVLEAIFRQLFLQKHSKKQGIIAEQMSMFEVSNEKNTSILL